MGDSNDPATILPISGLNTINESFQMRYYTPLYYKGVQNGQPAKLEVYLKVRVYIGNQ